MTDIQKALDTVCDGIRQMIRKNSHLDNAKELNWDLAGAIDCLNDVRRTVNRASAKIRN